MSQTTCNSCGDVNAVDARSCGRCGRLIYRSKRYQTKASDQDARPAASPTLTVDLKLAACALVVVALSIGSFFGYRSYAAWDKAKSDAEEVKKFTKSSFKNDPAQIEAELAKLPGPFRIKPPDIDFINKFPFRDKLVQKLVPRLIQNVGHVTKPTHTMGPVLGFVGNDVVREDQSSAGSTTWEAIYTKAAEIRMTGAARIDGYRYAKNQSGDLIVEIRFVAILDQMTKEGKNSGMCPPDVDCVTSVKIERYARMKLVRKGLSWEFVSVELEGMKPDLPPWTAGTESATTTAQPDLIPTYTLPYFPLQENPFDPDRDEFFGKPPGS